VSILCFISCFFFQAEDGIRDFHVTGVQTCALPILTEWDSTHSRLQRSTEATAARWKTPSPAAVSSRSRRPSRTSPTTRRTPDARSEERRVGKEGRYRRARSIYDRRKGEQRMEVQRA